MYQKDYILRMIEMIGDLMAGILGLIRKGKFDQASQGLSDIYRHMLREDFLLQRYTGRGNLLIG